MTPTGLSVTDAALPRLPADALQVPGHPVPRILRVPVPRFPGPLGDDDCRGAHDPLGDEQSGGQVQCLSKSSTESLPQVMVAASSPLWRSWATTLE